MKAYTQKAKSYMEENGSTFVFCNDEKIISSDARGVITLVEMVRKNETLKSFCCADKVVGKAAAFMYVFLNPDEIYAGVLSEKARNVFDMYKVNYCFGELVPAIINRTGDGFCPMETLVENALTPEEAFILIKEKLKLD